VRAFVAWNPAPVEADALEALRDRVKQARDAPGHRWLAREQLHVTLRFLGEADGPRLAAIEAALRACASAFDPFEACVAGWQYWPDRRSPRVLVLRIESRGAFERLGAAVESATQAAGFAPERRPFRAHLTLARIAGLSQPPPAFESPPTAIPLAIDHLALMESTLGAGGARYTEHARHALRHEPAP
jgi:RNA 2',3'-cyclic 3'-phosphodiesterase